MMIVTGIYFSVEEVNRLASEGMPFRDAYKKVGLDIEGKFTHNKKVHHTHEGSIGNLCNDRVENLMQQAVDGLTSQSWSRQNNPFWVDRKQL